MAIQLPDELEILVEARMATGHYDTQEEVIRLALEALRADEEDLAITRDAIKFFDEGGRGTPVAEAFAQVRDAVPNNG